MSLVAEKNKKFAKKLDQVTIFMKIAKNRYFGPSEGPFQPILANMGEMGENG